MKKIIVLALLVVAANAYALTAKLSRLGPALATLTGWNNSSTEAAVRVTISAGATGVRNCITKLTFISTSTSTLRILDGGTTVYGIDLAANTLLPDDWQPEDMCGSSATALHIKISTGVRQATLSTQQLNYTGFTY
jgi:hypothetical protein